MAIETYKCIKRTFNKHMGMECWSDDITVFYWDKKEWIKVGDEVKCERDDSGFYRKIWVNGILKTEDDFKDTHGSGPWH